MQKFLVTLILAIIQKLFSNIKPTVKNGIGVTSLEKKLREKAKKDGWEV